MRPESPPRGKAGSSEPEFRYGWRYVRRLLPEGSEELDRVPLTLEDVLHPQECDVIPENSLHESDCRYLADVFSARLLRPPCTLVTRDLLVNWGVEGIRNHSPDVGVFVSLNHEPPASIGVLDLMELGGRCELVVEVVSPHTRSNDVVDKFQHYHEVGIPLYVIVDQQKEDGPRSIRAYRHTPARYDPLPLDGQGRLFLAPLQLRLGMRDNRVICFDAQTEQELGNYTHIVRALEEADRRIEQQQQAIEEHVLARQEAVRKGNDYRQEADRQRLAREQAEQRNRELEDLLRRFQTGDAPDGGGVR